jgi:predicted ferric reductase
MNQLQMNEQLWWYVARSGGITALVLTGLSVIWGLALSTKVMQGTPTPKWLLSLHRWLGGLAVSFTGVHVAALVADSYVDFGLTDILVPFASSWKPGAVAWGIVSMYLLVAIQASSLMMKRLPRKLWKAIHMSSWFLFWTGVVHGATAGTDAGNPLYVLLVGTITLLIMALTFTKFLSARQKRRLARPEPVVAVG